MLEGGVGARVLLEGGCVVVFLFVVVICSSVCGVFCLLRGGGGGTKMRPHNTHNSAIRLTISGFRRR